MSNFNSALQVTLADVELTASLVVFNYQKYFRALPTFDQVDQIILNIAESIKDPKIRSRVRQYHCIGIVTTSFCPFKVLLNKK